MSLTKQDLNQLTKNFVTKTEFNTRADKLEEKVDKLEEKIDDLDEKIKFLPTKDEFYASMDKLMKELSTIREELALTPSFTQFADLEERVEALEKQIAAV